MLVGWSGGEVRVELVNRPTPQKELVMVIGLSRVIEFQPLILLPSEYGKDHNLCFKHSLGNPLQYVIIS